VLNSGEFSRARELLRRKSRDPADFRRQARAGRDRFGRYLEITLE